MGGGRYISSHRFPSGRRRGTTAVSSMFGLASPSDPSFIWLERKPPPFVAELLNQNQCLKSLAMDVNFFQLEQKFVDSGCLDMVFFRRFVWSSKHLLRTR